MVKRVVQRLVAWLFSYTDVDEWLEERFAEVFLHLEVLREYVDAQTAPAKAEKTKKTPTKR